MLTIMLNGQKAKLNIGCRTFTTLDVLLGLLSVDDSAVTLNNEKISGRNAAQTIVQDGDSLTLPGISRN